MTVFQTVALSNRPGDRRPGSLALAHDQYCRPRCGGCSHFTKFYATNGVERYLKVTLLPINALWNPFPQRRYCIATPAVTLKSLGHTDSPPNDVIKLPFEKSRLALPLALIILAALPRLMKIGPIERRPRITPAQRCHSAMACDACPRDRRVDFDQCPNHAYQRPVLFVTIGVDLVTFQFNSHREVIQCLTHLPTIAPARTTGMPGTAVKRHELHTLTVTPNQQVCGDP